MIKYIVVSAFVLSSLLFFISPRYENIVKIYDHTGLLGKQMKVWCDTVTVTSATQTIDYSNAGFISVMSINVDAELNSASAIVLPFAEIKSYSTTQAIVNLVQSTSQTVVLAATINGLQPLQSFTSTRLHIRVIGY